MRIASSSSALALLAAAFLLQSGCPHTSNLEKERPNIVFVLIDALRSDHLSCYGYSRNTTPVIDGLAEGGILFENAVAQAPWTLPSMASIFTSRRPLAVGVHSTETDSGMRHLKKGEITPLDDRHTTLAELLEDNGYLTICVTANYFASGKVNMTQGCQKYTWLPRKADHKANAVIDKAIEYLERYVKPHQSGKQDRPFFLYVHFIDPHEPNESPAPFDTLYPTLDEGPHNEQHRRWGWFKVRDPANREFAVFKSHKIALYDGSLSFVDYQIGRLLGLLDRWGLSENTAVVIASDHGEELWDHALFEQEYREDPRGFYGIGHGHTMFSELLNVPLILHGAGIPQGLRITSQVRNLDIMPTLLGLSGIDNTRTSMEGVDLLRQIEKRQLHDMIAFSEDITYGFEEKCVQDSSYKYIRGKDYEFLFDRKQDPTDTVNVIEDNPNTKRKLSTLLDGILGKPVASDGDPMIMTDEAREHLRHLGYLE